jgi:hypothetical protein
MEDCKEEDFRKEKWKEKGGGEERKEEDR